MENVLGKDSRKSTSKVDGLSIRKPEIKDLAKEYLKEISELSQNQKINLIYKNLIKGKPDQTLSVNQILSRILYRVKFGKHIEDTKKFLEKKLNSQNFIQFIVVIW